MLTEGLFREGGHGLHPSRRWPEPPEEPELFVVWSGASWREIPQPDVSRMLLKTPVPRTSTTRLRQGEVRDRIRAALAEGPLTARGIQLRTKLRIKQVNAAVWAMVRERRLTRAGKPCSRGTVYALVQRQEAAA